MDKLVVETPELKPEYKERGRLWKKYVRRVCRVLAWFIWRYKPLIHYPLVLDIELGSMEFYYLKYGLRKTLERINLYNRILVARLTEKETLIDPSKFYISTVLTSTEDIEEQLDRELRQVSLN